MAWLWTLINVTEEQHSPTFDVPLGHNNMAPYFSVSCSVLAAAVNVASQKVVWTLLVCGKRPRVSARLVSREGVAR